MSEPYPEDTPPLSAWRKAIMFIRLLLRPQLARKIGTLATEGYLAETGWIRSVAEDSVVKTDGSPQPWATLSFIDFIEPRLRPEWTVFEYGTGASTLYYASRVRNVIAVEHSESFAQSLIPQLPANARVVVKSTSDTAYATTVSECPAAPQLISVDGIAREDCVRAAIAAIAPNGVLVLDDAERSEYQLAHSLLADAGFKSIEFWGLAPGWVRRKCTTIFYRSANVLGI